MNATRPRKITLIFLKIFFNVKLNDFRDEIFFLSSLPLVRILSKMKGIVFTKNDFDLILLTKF